VDDDVQQLVREERLGAAAALASARGDARTASALFERACDWRRAASEALRASDAARALPLAIVAKDDGLAEQALARLLREPVGAGGAAVLAGAGGVAVPSGSSGSGSSSTSTTSPSSTRSGSPAPGAAGAPAAARVAELLDRRGDHAWAARVFEAAGGRDVDAARAWERAGEATRAAALLERANDAIGAARVLEAAIRRAPAKWANHVALGRLLIRFGKIDAAVRTLQVVDAEAPERPQALGLLVDALDRLGLAQASAEAARELARLGGAREPKVAEAPLAQAMRARLFGRYEVVREVASTASARVLECVDTVRGEQVAVKVFAGYDARGAGRDVLARFEREVKVLGSLDHPSVVPLRDYFPDGPALVLAWMSGGTLEAMMSAGPIAPARAVEIATAVLGALGEAHRIGVLHRDIKPANVLFDGAGAARLADFGVAHLGDLSVTATAGMIGTLAYMSPEQREGRPATVQSDLYGVGAILLEMLTGERAGSDDGGAPRLRPSGAHRDLGARHDDVVLALVAPEPAARPIDAFAARRALTALAWPATIEPVAPSAQAAPRARDALEGTRLRRDEGGHEIDAWIGRRIERVPLHDAVLARASSFARAGHPALQAVLRVDRAGGSIWLEHPRGAALDRPLARAEGDALRAAVDALHAAGGVHGKIDREHVVVAASGGLTLRFAPEVDATATVDLDRLAVARLSSP